MSRRDALASDELINLSQIRLPWPCRGSYLKTKLTRNKMDNQLTDDSKRMGILASIRDAFTCGPPMENPQVKSKDTDPCCQAQHPKRGINWEAERLRQTIHELRINSERIDLLEYVEPLLKEAENTMNGYLDLAAGWYWIPKDRVNVYAEWMRKTRVTFAAIRDGLKVEVDKAWVQKVQATLEVIQDKLEGESQEVDVERTQRLSHQRSSSVMKIDMALDDSLHIDDATSVITALPEEVERQAH